jgi:hypothetical protein
MKSSEVSETEVDLPAGWVNVSLSECVNVLDGQRVPINSEERKTRPGNIPY